MTPPPANPLINISTKERGKRKATRSRHSFYLSMTGKLPISTAHSDVLDLRAVPQFESTVIVAAQPATIVRLENGILGEDGGCSNNRKIHTSWPNRRRNISAVAHLDYRNCDTLKSDFASRGMY
jgi:hypothetical protein